MYTKEFIINILESYKETLTTINMLKLDLQSVQEIDPKEAIEELAFKRSLGERVQTGAASDVTSQVALNYRERADKLKQESYTEIHKTLMKLEHEIKLIETAISGLSTREGELIREIYFRETPLSILANRWSMTERNLRYIRNAGIDHLCAIYERYNQASGGKDATTNA